MKWELTEPRPGDMIRVKAGPLYHYGVYAADDEIIQFGRNPVARSGQTDADITVCITDMDEFLCGGFLEVGIPQKKRIPAKKTLETARRRLGEGGYHILYNNCEHFAYECVTGQRYCAQTENVRNLFRQLPVVDLYIASIPDGPIGTVSCAPRQAQIDATANDKLRRERYFVWKLLEYAVNRSFGLKPEKTTFSMDENGKWSCKECFFSLSHSRGALAVAISRKPVGVDIESLERPMSVGLPGKILTAAEQQEYDALPEESQLPYLLQKWCAKEALFKVSGGSQFRPTQFDAGSGVRTGTATLANHLYCYAVATDTPEKLRLYENIPL